MYLDLESPIDIYTTIMPFYLNPISCQSGSRMVEFWKDNSLSDREKLERRDRGGGNLYFILF